MSNAFFPFSKFFLDRLYVPPHVYYFNPPALTGVLQRVGFETVGLRGGNVFLGRYRLPMWMRIPMEIALHAGALVGMSAKIHVLARKPG